MPCLYSNVLSVILVNDILPELLVSTNSLKVRIVCVRICASSINESELKNLCNKAARLPFSKFKSITICFMYINLVNNFLLEYLISRKFSSYDNFKTFNVCVYKWDITSLNSSGSSQLIGAYLNIGAICSGVYPAKPHPIFVTLNVNVSCTYAKFKNSST